VRAHPARGVAMSTATRERRRPLDRQHAKAQARDERTYP
jgi:hypothetical protein